MTLQTAPTLGQAHIAGLRTRLISRLTGLSRPRLRYWHESVLLKASLRDGSRGTPRLYNWVDYLRLQLASHLDGQGVPTQRIREAISFLDKHFNEWWLITDPLSSDARRHVLASVVPGATPLVADGAGQFVIEWPKGDGELETATGKALSDIAARGSLCMLGEFADSVFMSPRMNLAQPTIVGTALETQFVAGMAGDMGPEHAARTFRVDIQLVRRAIKFEEALA